MVETSYHASVKELQGRGLGGHGPFAHARWFESLEGNGLNPLIVICEDGGSAAAMVFERHGRTLASATNWYAFTWQPLTNGDAPPIRALARALSKSVSRVDLTKLDEGLANELALSFRTAGWTVRCEPTDTNRILRVAGRGYATYHASLPGRLRTTLKRKSGKVEVRIATHFDEELWRAYESIYADSWKPEEGDPAFLERFARAEGQAGHIRLALATAAGEPVAAQFWTVDDGTAWIHKLAHRESAKALSPGSTLTAAMMQHVIDVDRVDLVDFGTGDDAYKRDWMDDARPRFSLTACRRGDPRNWPALAHHAARNLVTRIRPR